MELAPWIPSKGEIVVYEVQDGWKRLLNFYNDVQEELSSKRQPMKDVTY
jgi:hypothetical protein